MGWLPFARTPHEATHGAVDHEQVTCSCFLIAAALNGRPALAEPPARACPSWTTSSSSCSRTTTASSTTQRRRTSRHSPGATTSPRTTTGLALEPAQLSRDDHTRLHGYGRTGNRPHLPGWRLGRRQRRLTLRVSRLPLAGHWLQPPLAREPPLAGGEASPRRQGLARVPAEPCRGRGPTWPTGRATPTPRRCMR